MSKVSVSKDTLTKVKKAFGGFSADVDSTTVHVISYADQTVSEINAAVKAQKKTVEDLEKTRSTLAADIEKCNQQIAQNSSNISNIKNSILHNEAKINELNTRIREIEAVRSHENSSGSTYHINDLANLKMQTEQLARENKRYSAQLSEIQARGSQLKQQLEEQKSEYERIKNELNRQKNKYERLKRAGSNAENKLCELIAASKTFRQEVLTDSKNATSGIDRCIGAIDEYIAVNISGGGNNRSAAANQAASIQGSDDVVSRTLFELSVLRDDLELGSGDQAYPQIGGICGKIPTRPGFQRHHIPSQAVQDDSFNNLPAILISNSDHSLTDSYRGRQRHRHQSFLPDVEISDCYRDEVAAEIDNGNYINVVRNEIYNIIDTCGNRYDGAISQYLDALENYIRENGIPRAVYSRQGGS